MNNLLYVAYCVLLICPAAAGQRVMPLQELKFAPIVAQPDPIFFEQLPPTPSLPPGVTIPFLRDSRGFLWLTNSAVGLMRYDGYIFRTVKDTSDRAFGGNISVSGMVEDPKGIFWIACPTGLKRLDPVTGAFTTFTDTTGGSRSVGAACLDTRQCLWVGVKGAGLMQVDRVTGRFTAVTAHEMYDGFSGAVSNQKTPSYIRFIRSDANGTLWMTNDRDPLGGLYSFDPVLDKWHYYPFYQQVQGKTPSVMLGLYDIYAGGDPRYIWIGGYDGLGLLRLDTREKRWKQYLLPPDKRAGGGRNIIRGITPKQEGQFWIGTENGTFIFDVVRETFASYRHKPDDPASLPDKADLAILTDREGISWFMTIGGNLGKVVPAHQFFRNTSRFEGPKSVNATWKDPITGDVFYGIDRVKDCTEPFLVKASAKTGERITRACPEIPSDSCNRNSARALLGDPSRTFIWVSTGRGLFRLNPVSLKLTAVSAKIANHPTWTTDSIRFTEMAIDPDRNIWFGSRGFGLFQYEARTGRFLLAHDLTDRPEQPSPRIWTMQCDRQGRLWFNRVNINLARFDPKTRALTCFDPAPGNPAALQSGAVTGLVETADGRMWVATENGICVIGPDDRIRQVTALSQISQTRLMADQQGCLWMITEGQKIARYNPRTDQVRIFDVLINNDGDRMCCAADGELFFSDQYRCRPEALRVDSTPFNIAFTGFRIFEKDTTFARDLNYLDQVTLRHDQNFFTIRFAALAFANPAKNTYAYRLEGIDADWVNAGTRCEASYTNLPPGRYTFWVKAANEDGVWAAKPVSLAIEILPAWWQTWEFKLLVALAVLAVLAAFIVQYIARLRAKAEARQKSAALQKVQAEFRQRLAETEMAALRAQMNPHFLFNVMNSINRYLLENDATAASGYLTKFSRLIRLILDNSRSNMVPLGRELDALQLYVDLESLRFKQKLQCHIDVQPDIDLKYICIPPLLLQPYVENAIWHGLMHKASGGTVTITVRQPHEHLLTVDILDDGIGRAAAAASRSKSAQRHKSYGMEVTRERLALIDEAYQTRTKVKIHDLVDPDGTPSGTLVALEIEI